MTDVAATPENAVDNAPVFTLEKVYVKDLSVENPGAPDSFLDQTPPQIEVQLMHQSKQLADGVFDANLTATVTARSGEKVLFLVEVTQAGVFQVRNIPEEIVPAVLGVQCPTILFPYLRESISESIQKAGYTPIYLAPINFEAWYNEQQAAAEQAEQATA